MKRFRDLSDPFSKNQPALGFLDELKQPYHAELPYGFGEREALSCEVRIDKLSLIVDFPDGEGLLCTSFDDLFAFFALSGISVSDDGLPFYIRQCDTEHFEEYIISVTGESITLSAGDTEGIRRGLIYIQDECLRRGGPFLTIGEVRRYPFIKTRISRCFFTPPSHSPDGDYINELSDDIDYYDENYLVRLMHDGINALWIGAHFGELVSTSVIPEYGEGGEKKIAKLKAVVEKCRKYGIGIYLFAVEPQSGYDNPIFNRHTELHAESEWPINHFCPSLPSCEKHIKESIQKVFSAVPNLRGLIDITAGEAETGCGSAEKFTCKRCKKRFGTLGKTLAYTEKIIADALYEVAPEAEFISWTYAQRMWNFDDVRDACRNRDKRVIHMENFEDYGRPWQLGKKRLAIDYWLSYAGPGELMRCAIEENRPRGIRTYAKIQACSSHEISTVPYVPVPGLLYDKYKALRENGISGVLQCWYFGNYPCLMNKSACELSFEPFFDKKEDFLEYISKTYFGEDYALAREAYSLFERGYSNFPVSVSFEWYGPMQDSPVAPLRLLPIDLHMPETWVAKSMPGGDRIGEAIRDGHTLGEILTLLSEMTEKWKAGEEKFKSISTYGKMARSEQISVASAISVLFESGYNVMRFYHLRHRLGILDGDCVEILREMRKIVNSEMKNSNRLIDLCEADARLGYHSEANGYKFFKEKLLWRIDLLKRLLDTEFPYVEKRILRGEYPLEFYRAEGEGLSSYTIREQNIDSAKIVPFDEKSEYTYLCAAEKDGEITLCFKLVSAGDDSLLIRPEFHLFMPTTEFELSDGELVLKPNPYTSFVDERLIELAKKLRVEYKRYGDDAIYALSFTRRDFELLENEPFRLAVTRRGKHPDILKSGERRFFSIIDEDYSTDEYFFFIK